jgi:hypothetical protein
MRFFTVSTIVALFAVVYVASFAQAAEEEKRIGYLKVEESIAGVYEQLDPKSPLIRQAKKGEYLEIVYDGESWHKVKIDGKVGWIEKKAGKIVQNPGGVPVGLITFLVLAAAATLGGVFYFLMKNRTSAVAGVDEDI